MSAESLSVAFMTATRSELAAVAQTLAANIRPESLFNPEKPVIWSNHGSHNAGKSLIAEELTSAITGESVHGYFENEAGMFGFDSEFHSYRDDLGRQFQFCDIYFPWSGGVFSQRLRQQRNLVPKILEGQTSGGIVFLHNAPQAALENGADIEIRIRSRRKFSDYANQNARQMPAFARKSLNKLGLRQEYRKAVRKNGKDWVRLVETTIHNPDIFKAEFIHGLKMATAMTREMRESAQESRNHSPNLL
ncbi:MAG: hypothetical protein ACLFR0_09220 [Alphaproteobacteria bacterium]